MINREELSVGDKLTYTPGGCECVVADLSHYCVVVQDPDGSLQEVPPDDLDLYEYSTTS